MAYRQLCAVTFALLGFVVTGCGADSMSATPGGPAPTDDTQTPLNPDGPPSTSGDQAPGSGDQAPSSADTPPASSDASAGTGVGGRLGQLCQELCSSLASAVDRCNQGMDSVGVDGSCNQGTCDVPANVPCQNEIADAYECLLGSLDLICQPRDNNDGNPPQPGGDQQPPANDTLCAATIDTATACLDRAGYNDETDSGTTRGCFAAGGCECDDPCAKCTCQADGDPQKGAACFDTGEACDLATP